MEFEIVFYKDKHGKSPIEEFLIELIESNRILVTKTRQAITKLRYRIYHKEPLSKHLEQGLWELRVKSETNILRIVYTFRKGQIIILLHVFIKKQQKTPVNDLEIARKRLREIRLKEAN
ncbi:MAG: type II toxin-antitoxin system RelE/ParE family toxin [Candidatus Levybacteria bacterium]|nr:type II toxin-antitoxin system RelE/ParE family toxin [Candidatus Levybacteria bacterium]